LNKYLIILFIFFNAFVSFSQTAVSTRTIRVASADTAFNQNIAVGTLVIDTTENKLFLAKESIAGLDDDSQTLKKAADSFELINETIINDSSSVVEVSEVEEYATGTTKGGTIFVVTSDDNDEVIITLSTTDVVGKRYRVKKISNNTGNVKVETETPNIQDKGKIEGQNSIETNTYLKGWIVQFDGSNWYIIGHIGE
jgi:hypothetical protein